MKVSKKPRVVFMGTPDFAVPTLRMLAREVDLRGVVTNPDRRCGRGRRLLAPPVKTVAQDLGVPIFQPKSLKKEESLAWLRGHEPDLFIVVAYGTILRREALKIPSVGCLNVHASLLPKYRGAAPIQWALINNERKTGVSIMVMDEGMDTGPVLSQREESIQQDDNVTSLSHRLSLLGAELLSETLNRAATETLTPEPQRDNEATRAPMLEKCDGRVDWTQSAEEVAGRIRGTDPWPGGYTCWKGRRLKLFHPHVVDGQGRPGEVLGVKSAELTIACGRDAVAVAEMQMPGKRRMEARCVLTGCPIPRGTVLGQGEVQGS